jgi:imidazolonepropionase-like amidohydrolase
VRRLLLFVLLPVLVLGTAGVGWYWLTLYRVEEPAKGSVALTGATVLTGADLEPSPNTTVLITDGVIVEVGADGSVPLPAGTRVVHLTGRTVLPGLIDLHVHLGSTELDRGQRLGWWRLPGVVFDQLRFVPGTRRSLLEHGVTSVRSLGDEHAWVMEMRQLLRDRELEGPRLYAAGPLFTTSGGHPVATFGVQPGSDGVRLPTTPAEARQAVRELATGPHRVDLVKVVQERGSDRRPLEPIPLAVLQAIVDEAHGHDLPVVAHWGTLEDLTELLAVGVDGLEHLEARGVLDGWPQLTLQQLVDADVPLDPTLAVTEVAIPAESHRVLRQRLREFVAAGGTVVSGSDAGMPGVPFGGGLHRELELLVASGLTPTEALRAATSGAARALRAGDIGAIERGRAADLLVVDGKPHEDIGAVRNVVSVLRDGRFVVDRRPGG